MDANSPAAKDFAFSSKIITFKSRDLLAKPVQILKGVTFYQGKYHSVENQIKH